MGLIIGTLALLVAFLVLATAFMGIGLLVRRIFSVPLLDVDDCFLAFWTGFGVVNLILILWNFVGSIGVEAMAFVMVLGVAGIAWTRAGLVRMFEGPRKSFVSLPSLLMLVGGLWVANQALGDFRSYDGSLYHVQAVKWAESYPVVPGLANLHGPLAFNNSSFLYDAMLNSGFWGGRGFHLANGVLVFVIVLQAITGGVKFVRSGYVDRKQLYHFLFLGPAVYLAHHGDIASYSTDIPLTVVALIATAQMYELLDGLSLNVNAREEGFRLSSLAILLATAVCIKMSVGVLGAAAMATTVLLWLKRRAPKGRQLLPLIWVSVIVLVFAVPWMARGVIMSGYPFFPMSVAGFSVDWRAPVEHADAELAYIAFTEREFTWRIIGRNWIRLVVFRDIYSLLVPAGLVFGGLLLFCSKEIRRRFRWQDTCWIYVPVLLAIGVWFFSAPSTRYITPLFWTLAAVSLCEFLRVLLPRLAKPTLRIAFLFLVFVGVSPIVVDPALGARWDRESVPKAILQHNLILPNSDNWMGVMPEGGPEITHFTTLSGLVLNVPKRPTRPELQARPGNAPLPCTPNPASNLRLRHAGRLDKGFRVEGDWQMQDFPYYWHTGFLRDWRMIRAGKNLGRSSGS